MEEVKKILFCTDFSQNARVAFQYAVDAAKRHTKGELLLLHVWPEAEAQFWKGYVNNVEAASEDKAEAAFQNKVKEEYSALLPEGVTLKPYCSVGKPAVEIVKFATKENVQLIIMGRQGHGALESLFFGSVAEKVVRHASCPVLVIPIDK